MPRTIAELIGQQSPTPRITEPATSPTVKSIDELMSRDTEGESGVGRVVSELGGAAKTAAMKVLDMVGRPQNALFGAISEGDAGFRAGLSGEKKYAGADLLEQAGMKSDPYYARTIAGLGIDLVADPLNAVGLGPIRKALSGGQEIGRLLSQAPGIKPVLNALRPLNELDAVPGLRDFGRLNESARRSIIEHANEEKLKILSPEFKQWRSQLPAEDRLKAMSYGIDDPAKAGGFSQAETEAMNRFRTRMDEQFTKEVQAGQQKPTSKLKNYLPYITKGRTPDRNVNVMQDVSGTTRHAKARTLPDLASAVQQGADDNLANILHKRIISGDMAIHNAEMVENAATKFGSFQQKAGDWRRLDLKSQRKIRLPDQLQAKVKKVYFPKPVADYLEKAHVIFDEEEGVKELWKQAVVGWKSWVVATPQQHLTNFLGNVYNAYTHGDLSVPEMIRHLPTARSIVTGKKAMPAVGKYSAQEVEKLARKYEVIGTSGRYENISSSGKAYNYNPLSGSNIVSKASLHFGQHNIEEPFRLAVFLKNLKNGKTAEEAALAVKDVFFDYSELTDELKFARDYGLAPFITWMSKNIPLQITSTVRRPDRLARVESTLSAGQEALGGSETVVPKEDTREGLMGTGDRRATRVALPLYDLNKLPIGEYDLGDARNDWLGGTAAPLKMPMELLSGQKFYGGFPIDRSGKGDPVKPFDLISKLAEKTGMGAMVGINEEGLQNPYASYILGNNPIQYYNKFMQMADPENPLSLKEQVLGLSGARSKEISPFAEQKEIQRRIQQLILEP